MANEKITITHLDVNSVSISTQYYITDKINEYPFGDPLGQGYVNSIMGRAQLASEQPENIINTVLAMWGDTLTINDVRE